MLDALHTNQTTLRQILQDNGADYLLPVKGNHANLEKLANQCLPPLPPAATTNTRASQDTSRGPAGPLPLRPAPSATTARAPVRYRRNRRA